MLFAGSGGYHTLPRSLNNINPKSPGMIYHLDSNNFCRISRLLYASDLPLNLFFLNPLRKLFAPRLNDWNHSKSLLKMCPPPKRSTATVRAGRLRLAYTAMSEVHLVNELLLVVSPAR